MYLGGSVGTIQEKQAEGEIRLYYFQFSDNQVCRNWPKTYVQEFIVRETNAHIDEHEVVGFRSPEELIQFHAEPFMPPLTWAHLVDCDHVGIP